MSANTFIKQASDAYNTFTDQRADGLRLTTLSATTMSGTTIAGATVTASSGVETVGMVVNGYVTATQASSITTTVVCDGRRGQITTVSSTVAAGASAEFTLTNGEITAGDIVVCSCRTAGTGTPVAAVCNAGTGTCTVSLRNVHASAAFNNTIVIDFWVLERGSAA